MQLKNFQLCIDDCEYALSLLDAEDEARKEELADTKDKNKTLRSKLYFRKGMALLLQNPSGNRNAALKEYQVALKYDSKNAIIKQEIDKLVKADIVD